MISQDEFPLYHPQEVFNPTDSQLERPFPVQDFTDIYGETKSRVESLTELQSKLLNWYSECYEG